MQSILKRPIVTEKATSMNEQGVYAFEVDVKANKIQIKDAVEQRYGVTIQKVRTIRYAGKSKTRYTKSRVLSGNTSAYKKALVKVAEGEFIDIYDTV